MSKMLIRDVICLLVGQSFGHCAMVLTKIMISDLNPFQWHSSNVFFFFFI